MIISALVGNIHDTPSLAEGVHKETVHLTGPQLVKRVQRLITDHGNEYGLQLPAGSPDLRDGDVLVRTENNIVIIAVESSDVLIICPEDLTQMAFAAHSLGNRHLPAQFFGPESEFGVSCMVIAYDHTAEHFLQDHAITYKREEHVMEIPFRHAEHTH